MAGEGDLSPEELVRRFRAGDGEALCALFARHEEVLRRRIERLLPALLRRRVAVSDILQETRLVALDRHADFEPRGPDALRRWLLGIAANKARRACQRHLQVPGRAASREVTRARRPLTGAFAAAGPTPSQVAMEAERQALTQRALDSLPENYREVLRLVRGARLPLTEVARLTGRTHEATKKLYGRALVRLGRTLARLGI